MKKIMVLLFLAASMSWAQGTYHLIHTGEEIDSLLTRSEVKSDTLLGWFVTRTALLPIIGMKMDSAGGATRAYVVAVGTADTLGLRALIAGKAARADTTSWLPTWTSINAMGYGTGTSDTARASYWSSNVRGGYLTPADSVKLRNYSNYLYLTLHGTADTSLASYWASAIRGGYLHPADSTTVKNSLLKNADSTTLKTSILNQLNALYLALHGTADTATASYWASHIRGGYLTPGDSVTIKNGIAAAYLGLHGTADTSKSSYWATALRGGLPWTDDGTKIYPTNLTRNIGIGTATPAQKLDIVGGSVRLDNTTSSHQQGIIYKGSSPFISDFNYGNNGTVTTDGQNIFVGVGAGNLTMGSTATNTYESSYNTAVGASALYFNTTGYQNTANGAYALYSNTTGYQNTANGYFTLLNNTTGSNNTANGQSAGSVTADGSTPNQTSNNSLYEGYNTKASADGATNEIVIGANAIGNGSNSVTLGHTDITKTILRGNVLIGGTLQTTSGVAWDFGADTVGVVAVSLAHYLAVTVGGVAYKLALCV